MESDFLTLWGIDWKFIFFIIMVLWAWDFYKRFTKEEQEPEEPELIIRKDNLTNIKQISTIKRRRIALCEDGSIWEWQNWGEYWLLSNRGNYNEYTKVKSKKDGQKSNNNEVGELGS